MENSLLLEAEALVKAFGELHAVDELNLQVREGEMVGLVGPDGAGKTTTMRLLCGALQPTSGRIRIAGFELPGQVEQARQHIGYLAQRFSLYGDLTVAENLDFFGEALECQKLSDASVLKSCYGLQDYPSLPTAGLTPYRGECKRS